MNTKPITVRIEYLRAKAMETHDREKLKGLLIRAKSLACDYYELTHKPLGVTGEVAELEAAGKLGLELAVARTPFYDACRQVGSETKLFQIKGRAVARSDPYRGRVPSIKYNGEFNAVLLVLLDKSTFEAIEIWEAPREKIALRLQAPGSRARNERGSMGHAQFKSLADKVWPVSDPSS
jgi:hypothetical protein